jgi:transposase-like protein
MMTTNSRIDLLKEAMSIEKERAALQAQLDRLQARMDTITQEMFSGAVVAPIASTANDSALRGRSPRGSLKERVLGALAGAGSAGMRVKDLAATIASKPATLHSWFQFARKSIPAIRKTGPGRYRLAGPVAAATPVPKSGASKGSKRGELAAAILDALKAAGSKGVSVSEMSRRFDVKPRNLFVWFSTTAKKYKGIEKIAPGLYCLKR